MGVSNDVIDRLAQLSADRTGFEAVWDQVDAVAATQTNPYAGYNKGMLGGSIPAIPNAAIRSKKLYDSTGANAVDRLASGIEALVIPQSERWHDLKPQGIQRRQNTYKEKLWLEDQRNFLFETRYDADSGWVNAAQSGIRGCVAHGNGFLFVEEGWHPTALIDYRFMPLRESYGTQDHRGVMNGYFRYFAYTAEQAAARYGEKAPPKVKEYAKSATMKDQRFSFVQAIQQRGDFTRIGHSEARWISIHIEVDSKVVCEEKSFFEFPIVDFRWIGDGSQFWGEGPVMKCLSDIQSLQVMARNELIAGEQAVRPPMLTANMGVLNRLNQSPGASNLGGLNAQGQEMVKPMFPGQRLDFATMVLEAKRNHVKESMYLNLFALLVQNPQMSATEALIRNNEKGELLGPAGSRFQQSLSRMIDRELNILARKGMYDAKSYFRVPPGFQGKKIVPQMASALDRLRRAKEGEGIIRVLETVAPLAQADPSVVDEIHTSKTLRNLREIFGAPVDMLRDPEDVAQRQQARAQAQAQAQSAAAAKDMAAASKQGTDALAGMKEAGFI